MTALTSLGLFVLFTPLVVELLNDAKGDYNKRIDVVIRLLLSVAVGIFTHFIAGKNILAGINLAIGIHFMFFDYAINYILYRNGVITSPAWFSYLGRSSKVDKIKLWKSIGPYGRLFVKLFYFLISIWLYLKF